MKDIYILQIETATPVCSVALSKNGKTIVFQDADIPNQHASQLTIFISEVLNIAEIALEDLAAVAVSMGPGSYTGLRIGVSTAKGMCYGLDLPLIAINTLDAMVAGFIEDNDPADGNVLVPMIDARRMEVYMATYTAKGKLLQGTSAEIIEADFFQQDAEVAKYVLFGSGADKFVPLFKDDSTVEVIPAFANTAANLSHLAFEKYQQSAWEDLVYFEPFYLKDFIATTPKKR
ncbi:tRNA (adenosine(37)-N6)-threonylcarbamoyltransferase complex dimerization subunit type 1 TsaB [Sphingobacterium deserti]|nr:tRNA (adenosine(37)-N6)-threonylcarbamoyltransferase complex dimerization subunit type 1 TsaB [Sphingobacterium deserti]